VTSVSVVKIKSAVAVWDVLQCTKPAAKCTHLLSIKVTCSSVWLCCIGSLLPESCS